MKKWLLIFIHFYIGLTVVIAAGSVDKLDTNILTAFAYSPDDSFIAAGTAGGTIKLLDAGDLNEIKRFTPQTDIVWQMEFNPAGTCLAVLSNRMVTIFEIETGNIVLSLSEPNDSNIGSFAYRYDGNRIVTGSYSGELTIWDSISGNATIAIKEKQALTVSYSPDGNHIIGASEHDFYIYNANNGEKITSKSENNAWVKTVSYSPDGKKVIAVFSMKDHTGINHDYITDFINIYDSTNYELVNTIRLGKGTIKNAVFSPHLKFIIVSHVGYNSLKILVLNPENGNVLSVIIHSLGLSLQKNTFALSNNGDYIAYCFGYDVRVRRLNE
ncbi:MAG: hypothetical protein LBI67_00985 [Treponema sp.]|jgi:WD40 repeat protein|nr:hypothetical protein [Treponema sp.]